MRATRWLRLVASLFAVALILAACGGDNGGGTTGGTTGDGATGETVGGATGETGGGGGGTEITIEGFAFHPSSIQVSGPTKMTITNDDSAAHTFTLEAGGVDEVIGGGESATVTVDVSETTGFFCRFHPGMTGTVEVA